MKSKQKYTKKNIYTPIKFQIVLTLETFRVRESSMNYSELNLKRKRINFYSLIKGDKKESTKKGQNCRQMQWYHFIKCIFFF